MKRAIWGIGILSLLASSSCIPTVHPLYSSDTLVESQLLEGRFSDEDSAQWQFRKELDHYYLVMNEHGKEAFFFVHLVQLDDYFYLDFFPDKVDALEINEFLLWHLLPVHLFARVEIHEDKLDLYFFDPQWLRVLLDERRIRIKHEQVMGNYLITASTEELQKFVTKYGHLEEAYVESEPIVLNRS
ncbi:MAG: hypothetical protein OEM26_19520 [Saprospiraceae bacterium]|nr:hypothetical protein [Saprospiraceae bacterium]